MQEDTQAPDVPSGAIVFFVPVEFWAQPGRAPQNNLQLRARSQHLWLPRRPHHPRDALLRQVCVRRPIMAAAHSSGICLKALWPPAPAAAADPTHVPVMVWMFSVVPTS